MTKSKLIIEEQQRDQIGWYETSLSLMERKKRGHFSTPPLLVEKILDAVVTSLTMTLHRYKFSTLPVAVATFL